MNRTEEIADLTEKAATLVRDLEALRKQAGQFSDAKEELKTTREELSRLIDETKTLAVQNQQVLTHLNKIGSGEILEQLTQVQRRQKRMLIDGIIGFGVLVLVLLVLLIRMPH
jgi:hypothetical protein